MRAFDVATKFENLKIWKFASETMACFLSRFSFATAAENSSDNQNTVKSTVFGFGLEKVVFREGNCQGNQKLQADLA